jgi:ribonuclease P/MRP protein subunit RPP40
MVSGLKDQSYEEKLLELNLPSLEERRLHADMVQTFKIVMEIDRVDHKTWFQLATDGGRANRSADCPLNLRQKAATLEIRRNFFSIRVIDYWNL